jgi:hypothetical protein
VTRQSLHSDVSDEGGVGLRRDSEDPGLGLWNLVADVVRHTPDRRAVVLMTRLPDRPGKTVWFECDAGEEFDEGIPGVSARGEFS